MREKPIRVIRGSGRGHRTETRIFERKIWETWCVQARCRFRGQRAEQGICYSREPFHGGGWAYVDRVMAGAERSLQELRSYRRRRGLRAYVRYLEGMHVGHVANETFTLDELIRLRATVAVAKSKAKRCR